eukprot:20623-Pelagococcus_subviridis.AAC.1
MPNAHAMSGGSALSFPSGATRRHARSRCSAADATSPRWTSAAANDANARGASGAIAAAF